MAIAGSLPKPAIYVIPDPDPNAFATGTGPERSSVAVTQGLLDSLNREELQAVVRGGELLPQKSTHFYPKLLDGLVFHRLGE